MFPHTPSADPSATAPWLAALLRGVLVAGSVGVVLLIVAVAQPAAHLLADTELARLLRGMALIKGALSVAALAVLLWRFGHRTSPGLTMSYLVGAWLVCGASAAIWQLASVPLAAVLFHAGELTLLVAAWRDRRDPVRQTVRAPALRPVAVVAPAEPAGMVASHS
jgi:hypothetical protein